MVQNAGLKVSDDETVFDGTIPPARLEAVPVISGGGAVLLEALEDGAFVTVGIESEDVSAPGVAAITDVVLTDTVVGDAGVVWNTGVVVAEGLLSFVVAWGGEKTEEKKD